MRLWFQSMHLPPSTLLIVTPRNMSYNTREVQTCSARAWVVTVILYIVIERDWSASIRHLVYIITLLKSIMFLHVCCHMCLQVVLKKVLLIKAGQWTQDVQTEDLWTAHQFPVVWCAIMEPLKGLVLFASVMMVLFWWEMSLKSAGVMAVGTGAHPGASQVHLVAS